MIDYTENIESWIRKIDDRLSEPSDAEKDRKLAKEIVSVFHGEIDGIKHGLDRHGACSFASRASSTPSTIHVDDRGDLER